ncbi:MAG TPA: 4-hydroxyphenylpyruvate dioxygenase [Streptosporangiaceae bacterium]|nr:4-hydroxyphenylpyruvate dioxygenase [Streptosporangiaceae bacterium]
MKIYGFDHVEYYVADLAAAAAALCDAYGFRVCGRSPAAAGQRSLLLRQGQIRLLLTSPDSGLAPGETSGPAAGPAAGPLAENDRAARYIARHGDGVGVIAFRIDDVRQAHAEVVAAGGISIAAPSFACAGEGSACTVGTSVVAGFGDVLHKLVERSDPDGDFAPGIIEMDSHDPGHDSSEDNGKNRGGDHDSGDAGVLAGPLLDLLDHVAVCLPAGELNSTVSFYRNVFGLAQIYDERIEVGSQAMLSKVVQDNTAAVTFTLIEPDVTREPGQIDDFLAAHDGAGVQHLAFRTSDIATAVRTISARGVEFLVAPAGYYQALEGRLGKLAIPLEELRGLNVLADRDRWGQMFQIFARSTHQRHTLFIELIERKGALTFGSRNIRALYEALEDEHAGKSH